MSHQTISLPDLWLMIDDLAALCGAWVCAIAARSVPWLELDGLAHQLSSPLPSPLRVEDFSIEHTVLRASRE